MQCYDSQQTAAQADHILVFIWLVLFHLYHVLFVNNFNKAELVAERIKREKRIKRGSDAFQGFRS